jgi:MYND finger
VAVSPLDTAAGTTRIRKVCVESLSTERTVPKRGTSSSILNIRQYRVKSVVIGASVICANTHKQQAQDYKDGTGTTGLISALPATQQAIDPTVRYCLRPSRAMSNNRENPGNAYQVGAAASIPPCDGCLALMCGSIRCCECESVFYCSRACQVSHWRRGHKFECAGLKRLNEEQAQAVLRNFFEDPHSWDLLATPGMYAAAVRLGLHDKIREALEWDRDCLRDRLRAGQDPMYYTGWIMPEIFRAHGVGEATRI